MSEQPVRVMSNQEREIFLEKFRQRCKTLFEILGVQPLSEQQRAQLEEAGAKVEDEPRSRREGKAHGARVPRPSRRKRRKPKFSPAPVARARRRAAGAGGGGVIGGKQPSPPRPKFAKRRGAR